MANPLAALGKALTGQSDDNRSPSNLHEAIDHDDAHATARFLRGVDINSKDQVCKPRGSLIVRPYMHSDTGTILNG